MGFLNKLKKGITAGSKDTTDSQKSDISTEPMAPTEPAPTVQPTQTTPVLPKITPTKTSPTESTPAKTTEPVITAPTPTDALRKEEKKEADTKKGMLREENIFSFKKDEKEKKNVIQEEQKLYHRVHDVKELESGTEGELSDPQTNSKNSMKDLAEKRGALQQLREMNEASKENTIDITEWKQSDDTVEHPEDFDSSTIGLKTKPKANEQSIEFSWERNSAVEPPTEKDFMASRIRQAGPELNANKKEMAAASTQPGEANAFGWERRDVIDQPNPNDFTPKKIPEVENTPKLGWRNKEDVGEEKEGMDKIDVDNPTEKINGKEKKEKTSTESSDTPAWLRDDFKEEKIEVPEGMERGPKRIEEDIGKIIGEDSTKDAGKKELKTKEQVDWLEGDVDSTSLEEDVLTEMKKSVGPKWKSKGRIEIEEEDKEAGEKRRPDALSTPIDKIFDLLTSYKQANSTEIAEYAGLKYDEVEIIARKFEEEGVVELKYYTTPGKRPAVILKEDVPSNIREIPKGKVIDKYEMIVDFVPVLITIVEVKGEPRPIYTLGTPSIGKYTRKFLDIVKDEVAETMPIDLEEILDPRKSKKLKVRFFKELTTNLGRYLSDVDVDILNPLSGIILHELYGLGDIELFMADDMLEEVAINSAKTPLTVYHRVYGWMKTNVFIDEEERIVNYASQIGRKVGREITVLKPILDAHLLSGDRVNSTLFPISSEGNTLTIRRFARRPWTIIDFIGTAHTMNTEMAALLWLAMQYELNVLVAGGTASGKTSALNTLLAMVPPYHRLISIEDVREIILPKYLIWNWVSMVTRSPNPEGLGEVTMLELMHSSLRMRPDRIIVGEIRRHKEAEVLMEAIETGHSIYSTVHANSAYQVLRRLVEPPMNIPPLQVELLDIIIVQYRDRKSNKRRTYEIAEIEQTSSGQGLQVNTIYKWAPRTDTWDKLSKPVKLLTLLNLHTGLTEEDINIELATRKMILEWMRNNNITSLDDIGLIMKIFYSDMDKVKKLAKKNVTLEEFKKKV